jgi:hypothetical protein
MKVVQLSMQILIRFGTIWRQISDAVICVMMESSAGPAVESEPTADVLAPPDDFPFPFEPYGVQKDFMRQLWQTLDAGHLGQSQSSLQSLLQSLPTHRDPLYPVPMQAQDLSCSPSSPFVIPVPSRPHTCPHMHTRAHSHTHTHTHTHTTPSKSMASLPLHVSVGPFSVSSKGRTGSVGAERLIRVVCCCRRIRVTDRHGKVDVDDLWCISVAPGRRGQATASGKSEGSGECRCLSIGCIDPSHGRFTIRGRCCCRCC